LDYFFSCINTSTISLYTLSLHDALPISIRLDQFADVLFTSGPTLLERRDKSPSVSVQAQVVGRPAGTVADEWETEFSKVPLKPRSEEHTSELQSRENLVCRLLLEKKNQL